MSTVKSFIFLLGLLATATADLPNKNYAISVANLGVLFDYDEQLVNTLEDYANILQNKVDVIESYVVKRRAQQAQAEQEDLEKYLSNPLNSFALMRHMHFDWHNWLWYLKQINVDHVKKITDLHHELPTVKDMEESSDGLNRLQTFYDLNGADMANGLLSGVQYNVTLSPLDCYFMGKYCLANGAYREAEEWMGKAFDLYLADETNWPLYTLLGLHIENLYLLYADILVKLKRQLEAVWLIEKALSEWPNNPNLLRSYMKLKMTIRSRPEGPKKYEKPDLTIYQRCCTTECRPNSRLYCVYNDTISPFLRLAPFKMELLSLDPYVVIFHDVLYENEIAVLKKISEPILERAVTYNFTTRNTMEDPARTTKGTWINDEDHPQMERLARRVSDMTNFDTAISEPFQVMNYGIGGHYLEHVDFLGDGSFAADYGDRISTMLFYLSDVPQGGATLFLNLEISILPKKGAALLWYNIDHMGDGDANTLHLACPTIVGSRWVMSKWIGSAGQIFRRPCLANNSR